MRAANTATMSAASSTTSWNCMSSNSFGTRIEASTNTSECAQKAICAQRSLNERPIVGGDARPPKSADGQSGAEHGDDAGNVHDLFGGDEDEIGKRDGQRRFGQSIVRQAGK